MNFKWPLLPLTDAEGSPYELIRQCCIVPLGFQLCRTPGALLHKSVGRVGDYDSLLLFLCYRLSVWGGYHFIPHHMVKSLLVCFFLHFSKVSFSAKWPFSPFVCSKGYYFIFLYLCNEMAGEVEMTKKKMGWIIRWLLETGCLQGVMVADGLNY